MKNRFILSELLPHNQLRSTGEESDTISFLIYRSIKLKLKYWIIADKLTRKVCKSKLLDDSFEVEKPTLRIAGQKLEVGSSIIIPKELSISRNGKLLSFWGEKDVTSFIETSKGKEEIKGLKNSTYLEDCRILSFTSSYVVIEATQLSSTTLKTNLDSGKYEPFITSLNFKRSKIKIDKKDNKMLFI
jgi:hypothetical protein